MKTLEFIYATWKGSYGDGSRNDERKSAPKFFGNQFSFPLILSSSKQPPGDRKILWACYLIQQAHPPDYDFMRFRFSVKQDFEVPPVLLSLDFDYIISH
jgi:hypothetical protein